MFEEIENKKNTSTDNLIMVVIFVLYCCCYLYPICIPYYNVGRSIVLFVIVYVIRRWSRNLRPLAIVETPQRFSGCVSGHGISDHWLACVPIQLAYV